MSKTLSYLTAAAALFASTSAFANDYSFKVDRSELMTGYGIERTLKRIERIAVLVCGVNERRSISDRMSALACKADVMAEIVERIDNPQLRTAYAGNPEYAAR